MPVVHIITAGDSSQDGQSVFEHTRSRPVAEARFRTYTHGYARADLWLDVPLPDDVDPEDAYAVSAAIAPLVWGGATHADRVYVWGEPAQTHRTESGDPR